jgi:hypothetical protein
MPLTGQDVTTSRTGTALLTGDRHLRRNDLRLDRRCQLVRLGETKTEIGHAGLLIASNACDLNLRRLPGFVLCYQLDPPDYLWHQLTLVP